MKLGKAPEEDPIKRNNIPLRESTWTQLEQYRGLYNKTYGRDIKTGELIEMMLVDFMGSDKDFKEHLKSIISTPTSRASNA